MMVITWCVATAAGRVSDVTARYAYRWCTHTQKLRVDVHGGASPCEV